MRMPFHSCIKVLKQIIKQWLINEGMGNDIEFEIKDWDRK
jgi:hypothetical protein